jgi:hypothetical protein
MKRNILIAIAVFVCTIAISLVISDVIKKNKDESTQHYSVVK